MRIVLLTTLALSLSANAWLSAADAKSTHDAAYSSWSKTELKNWLQEHNVDTPSRATEADLRNLVASNWYTASAWTYDQYAQAQRTFADIRDTAFDKWDESRLREFLLRQGIVAPKGPREQLVVLARNHYNAYQSAAKSFTDQASATATSAATKASAGAEGAIHRASAAITQAETSAARALDRTKDYIFSSWSDSQLRKYLEDNGLVKTKTELRRDEMLATAEEYYNKVTNPAWDAWSDSYMHEWLVSHNVIKSDFQKNREKLRAELTKYYYNPTDRVWSTWTDSDMRQWLIDHGYIKSDAQVTREKMTKMVEDNYLQGKDTFWSAWSDNQIRQWLIDHGYMRSDAQVKRDELVKLANEKYNDASAKTSAYLTWPDARLRAYLRENGVDDSKLPGDRPGLLQETRIRWIQTQNRAEATFLKIRDIVNEGVEKAEDALYRIMNVVSGGWIDTRDRVAHGYENSKEKAAYGYENSKERAAQGYEDTKRRSGEFYDDAKEGADTRAQEAREKVGEKVKQGGQKIKGEL